MSSDSSSSFHRAQGKTASPAEVDLFTRIKRTLYTAALSDALDEMGFRHQVMRENLRPIAPDLVFAGWARTVSCMDVNYIHPEPYALELEALDSVLRGEVLVVGTGESTQNAPWGELLSTAAKARGARGAVVDGFIRDVKKILSIGFPVFATGIKAVDSQGRGMVVDYNVPTDCGGVIVNPGDLIVADYDGVLAIPASAVQECVERATIKANRENTTRDELEKGAYLRDVYAKYGIL